MAHEIPGPYHWSNALAHAPGAHMEGPGIEAKPALFEGSISAHALASAMNLAYDAGAKTATLPAPVPMLLWCPACYARHLDVGRFATKPHHTHACQACGLVWRPALVDTVGVEFLPGFRNEP